MRLIDELEAEVGPVNPRPGPKKTNGKNGHNGHSSWFELVNSVSTVDVLNWLGIAHDEKHATCVGCGEDGALICKEGGCKCLHDRCASAGPAGFPGFRSNVDLTAEVHKCAPLEAVKLLSEGFGIPNPSKADNVKDEHREQQAAKQEAKKPRTFKDIVNEWRKERKLERVDTGIHTLDDLCRGGLLIPRRVVLVGAPSAGKTYIETTLANRFLTILADRGFLVGIHAVDEDPSDVTARFAQMRGFSRNELEAREPATLDEVESALNDDTLRFYDYEWLIDEAVQDLASWCKESKSPGVLFVDSVHAVRCTASENAKSPRDLVESNLKALKLANEQHGLTIICTAEMNRSGYANAEVADKANKMALAAESRAFEFWAQLQITLQTPKDFGHIVHCVVSKNRGASKGEFWLELDHERHALTECGNPDENPVNVRAKEDRKLDGKNRKNLADANLLGKFILSHPGLGTRKLRTEVSAAPLMGWGTEKLEKALAVLRQGQTIYRLIETPQKGSHVFTVTLEKGTYDD